MKKKAVAFLLTFFNLLNIVNVGMAENNQYQLSRDKNVAEAYLGKNVQSKGFSDISFGKTAGESYIKYDEKECWLLDKSQGQNKSYIDFAFDSAFKQKSDFDGSVYDIEIEYYDYLEGFFFLYYDGTHDDVRREETVYLTNAKQWKTAKFTLTDADFNKGIEGKSDFRLSIEGPIRQAGNAKVLSQNSIAIHHVKVTRRENKNPVLAVAEVNAPGNSFAWFSNTKEIETTLKNVTGKPIQVLVTYRLISDNGNIPFEKNEELSFGVNETKQISVDVGSVKECGIYTYEVYTKYPGSDGVQAQELTKAAILKTDPDGIKNNDVMYAPHFDRYSKDSIKEGVAVLGLSNSYGGRMDMSVGAMINPETGEYNADDGIFIADEMLKYGMKATGLVWQLYRDPSMRDYQEIPGGIGGERGEAQLKAWENGVKFVAEAFKGKVDYYEIWNEPNLGNFNYDLTTGDGHAYAKMAKVAVDAFAEVNPDAKVLGPGITGIGQGADKTGSTQIGGKHYFDQAMEAGMWKSIKDLSFHAYSWNTPQAAEKELVASMKQLQEDYIKAGAEKPKLWITEMGFSKAATYVGDYVTQGSYVCHQLINFKVNDVLDYPCTVYNFESTSFPKNEREGVFGHVNMGDDNSKEYGTLYFPEISYLMVTAYNYVMANAKFEKSYDYEDGSVRINKFWSDKFNKNIVALHTTGKNEYVTMNLGTDHITYYDSIGNSKDIYSNDGLYTFTATIEPCYIVGDIKNVEVIKDNNFNYFEGIEFKAVENDWILLPLVNKSDRNYSVKINAPEKYVSDASDYELKSGEEILIKMMNTAPQNTNYTIDVDICDGEKTIQSTRLKIASRKGMESILFFEPYPGDNVNKWIATLRLTNLSTASALKGKIAFQKPDFMKEYYDIKTGLITPGRTGEVKFIVSDIVKKGIFGFEYDVITENGGIYSFTEKADFTIAKYAKNKPKIDGIAEKNEWFYDSAMCVDDESQVKQIKDWRGIYDLSGKVVIEWDEENMYLFGEVTDDIFSNDTTPNRYWEGDGIQFGVVYDDLGWVAFGETNTTFHEIGIGLFGTGAAAYRTGSHDASYEKGFVEGAEVQIVRNENTTVYEMRIPWKNLLKQGQNPVSGDELGFSYLINDNDGSGRRGWIEYASGIGETKNTRLFTAIKLID